MKIATVCLTITAFVSSSALAQTEIVKSGPQSPNWAALPQFMVDPFWPKPLPNNWPPRAGRRQSESIASTISGSCSARARSTNASSPARKNRRRRNAVSPLRRCWCSNQSGNLIRHWGGPGPRLQLPKSEHSVYIDDNDFIWLAGNDKVDGQLLKFTMDGKFVLQIGKPIDKVDSNATERLGSPADIAVDVRRQGGLCGGRYGNRRVVVFDSETGAYKRHWGAYGNRPSDEKTAAL